MVDGTLKFYLAYEARNYIKKNWKPQLNSDSLRDDQRLAIWDVYDKTPIDGLLISYHPLKFRAPRKHVEKIEKLGVHEALGYRGTIIADSGAFSYVSEDEPPFDTSKLLEYYDRCGFDIGATMDHLIIGQIKKDEDERKRRYNITLKNAEKMREEWLENYQESFDLMGAIQGWDPKSYGDAAERLIGKGFNYLGIGGLAGASTEKLSSVVKEVDSRRKSMGADVKIHVFGVSPIRQGSMELLKVFRERGVDSFDTSVMLRQAWNRIEGNYILGDDQYAALRVPMALEDEKAIMILESIREYARSGRNSELLTKELMTVANKAKKWEKLYEKTLQSRPWEHCGCSICKEFGVDVIIFRGNERNMRRGFHNVWQFYNALLQSKEV